MTAGAMGKRRAERDPDDFYPTPAAVAILGAGLVCPTDRVLDPAAGDGCLLDAAHLAGAGETIGIELDLARWRACARVHACSQADALALDNWPNADVLCNPPFHLADEFVGRIATHLAMWPLRRAAVLLSLGWPLALRRRALWRQMGVREIVALVPRPRFDRSRTTTAFQSYGWFVMGSEPGETACSFRIACWDRM